ncbi:MAG: hypothetical protein CME63_08940 [Halobacteriovoraceae bacterium]|nr:hypothetical protein [Halobacteriovoraceae bacterium]MBC97863.1 hypothetical protein [Halobacteriovoraceae bacterium]|tara:strand:+ start:55009 stop:55233 length:225 start_codon:yes stop_codon:yes gene_type:complete
MLDNIELESLMSKLENLEDEQLAVELLRELNNATSHYGKLLMNQNEDLPHEHWKDECDKAKKNVDEVVLRIKNL